MKKIFTYPLCLAALLYFVIPTTAQTKNTGTKRKSPVQQKAKPLVFTSEAAWNKWVYEDSVKRAMQDSIDYSKDSIASELESKKWANEISQSWYPKDSLSYVDDIIKKTIALHPNIEADSAVVIIKNRFTSSLQKARAIFYWVASTIQYDFDALNNNLVLPIFNKDSDAVYTFRNKKGVCQNYANLYKYMCDKAVVECKCVDGLGKNFPFCINPREESNHEWNCIKTNKGWMLLDVTWARIDSGGVDSYWFNIPPEESIYNHFPLDSSLQFLKKKISREQFLSYPIVSDFLFKSKLDFEIPDNGIFRLTENKFAIGIPQEEKNYTIGYSIIPYKGDDYRPYMENREEQDLETKTIVNKKDKTVDYEVEIPAKGTWWLLVTLHKNAKKTGSQGVYFPKVILLKIIY